MEDNLLAVDDRRVGAEDAQDGRGVVVHVRDLGDGAGLGRGIDRAIAGTNPAEDRAGHSGALLRSTSVGGDRITVRLGHVEVA